MLSLMANSLRCQSSWCDFEAACRFVFNLLFVCIRDISIYKLLSYIHWLSNASKHQTACRWSVLILLRMPKCARYIQICWSMLKRFDAVVCHHVSPCTKHMLSIVITSWRLLRHVKADPSGVCFKYNRTQPCSHKDSAYPTLCLLEIALTE